MAWKPVAAVFQGGTEEARRLKGLRIRAVQALPLPTYRPGFPAGTAAVARGQEGFVGMVPAEHLDQVVLGFPKEGPLPESLDALVRRPFVSVLVNWPTFKRQFEIAL